jgi:hypothetical protein
MQSEQLFVIMVAVVAGTLALAASILAIRMCITANPSRRGIILAILPSLLMVGLFYSLAIHMHYTLGRWPSPLEGGPPFPFLLSTHIAIAVIYFVVIILLNISVWPIAFLLCVFIRRWRIAIIYLGAYAFSFLVCFGSMFLAPSDFLDWWCD